MFLCIIGEALAAVVAVAAENTSSLFERKGIEAEEQQPQLTLTHATVDDLLFFLSPRLCFALIKMELFINHSSLIHGP